MNKLVYFLVVGLAFTVLQVSTVAAETGAPGAPMCDSNPACDPSDPAANCCAGMCDPNPACVMDDPNAIPCCGQTDGPPPGEHHDQQGQQHDQQGQQHDQQGQQHDGPPPGEDCANKPTPEETAACWDQQGGHMDHPGDHPGGPDGDHPPGEHHDGPPPGEDCANKPTPEETAACWDQQGGHMDHPPTMGAPGMPPMTPPPGAPHMPPGDHSAMSSLGAHCGAIQAKNEKKRMRKEVKCLRRALHEHKPTVKLRQTKDGLGAYGCGVRKTGSKPAQIACLRGMLDAPSGTPGMAPGTR